MSTTKLENLIFFLKDQWLKLNCSLQVPSMTLYLKNKINEMQKKQIKKTLWPLFMDVAQLSQGVDSLLRWKDERLSQIWSHLMVLNPRPLYRESSALPTTPLLHQIQSSHFYVNLLTFHEGQYWWHKYYRRLDHK